VTSSEICLMKISGEELDRRQEAVHLHCPICIPSKLCKIGFPCWPSWLWQISGTLCPGAGFAERPFPDLGMGPVAPIPLTHTWTCPLLPVSPAQLEGLAGLGFSEFTGPYPGN
jgi:hypothetical protein